MHIIEWQRASENEKEGSSEWARRVKERHEEDKKDNFADNIYANKIFQNDSLNWRVSLGRSQNIDNE